MLPDTTVQGLDELHRMARSARGRLEPVWYLNLSYYVGEQWLAWDGRQLYRPSLRANRITVVDNRIQPAVRMEVAKMTKSRPVFTVTPRTGDDMDINASHLAEQLMRYLWGHLHMQDLCTKALFWSRITGAGFLKVYWDSTVGEKRDVLCGPDGNVLCDATGKPLPGDALPPLPGVQRKTVAQGDVRVEARSPFQMFVDPLADSFSEAEWVIEESVKSADYVKRRYGVDIEPDTPANPGLVEARMGAIFLPGNGNYKGVKVREYWRRPCDQHPNGLRAVWASQRLLDMDEKPFDPFPYVMLSGIPVPGRLWPTSIVEQLRGPQTELNKVKSQIAENRNRVGNPTILASKQAVQDPEKFAASTTQPGGIYFFDDVGSPNTVPTYLQAPPLPDYVVTEIQRIEESIQEISGQHDVSSAQVPPGVTAASAINLLQEADDTRLGPAITDYEYNLGVLGQKILKHVAQFYSDARTIKIAGDNGAWQFFDFRGAMLRDNTHVQVQAGSAFPQSKAAKQAAMQDLLTFFVQSGNPPHGRQLAQFLQDWEVGGAERLIREFSIDEEQCNRENIKLAMGVPLPVNIFDDDQAHVDNHTDFQKQAKYQMLPPQIQHIFEMHVDEHRQRLAAQAQHQLDMQQQMQGGGQQQPQQPQPGDTDAQAAQLQLQGAQQQMDFAGQQQQQAISAAQAHQQLAGTAAQQDNQVAQAELQRRHAEEQHQQKMRHAEEQHQVRLAAMAKQAERSPQPQKPQNRKAA